MAPFSCLTLPITIAKEVRTLRRILGLTQQQLADFIGASQVAVARWETGVHKPTGANLKLLRVLAERAAKKRHRE